MTPSDERLSHIEQSLQDIQKAEKPLQKYFLQIITIVFIAGGGWFTLDSLAEAVQAQEEVQEKLETKNAELDKKVAVLEANQSHIKDKVDSIDKKIDKLIEQEERRLREQDDR